MTRVETKADIINLLIEKYGFTSYLEIVAANTGLLFGSIDRHGLERCDRLVYNCRGRFYDGQPVTWRSDDLGLDPVIAELFQAGRRYDAILVDSYHSYQCTARDIAFAMTLVSERGIVIVHDSCPTEARYTTPYFQDGPWVGQSYVALIDWLLMHTERRVYTVDVDWGVTVIGSRAGQPLAADVPARGWRAAPENSADRFAYFTAHRDVLLNRLDAAGFLALEGLRVAESV